MTSDAVPYADPGTARRILSGSGDTWAVVGLSGNTSRAAYGVARALQRFGKRIVPVHPRAETVHGERGYASLADVPFPVDVGVRSHDGRRPGHGHGPLPGRGHSDVLRLIVRATAGRG